ncbi:hypothetical protein AnigIFM59636_010370 [Aspergillus niger]|uniref:Contig An07c0170, genomic contig n=3 Tax=Aspergillus TaxID=5052 RepID=A2QNN2_ASPNC|nr:uncharacterized protein An07g06390 [Aspergillus niger]XP_025455658.1 uncharacterized protein BO96DRAFT_334929 [Aspergillus niger CBS 101883]RDK36431.1 hypothetical protein M752DRAFT_226404 [Aspergillus phoenicis ATCC 13157]PYH57603.1 hypothetical protein BO96DRAFT_334929 [Aspergillus niger CBS 101883]CAK39484.1 unnamed protein product [Aspergillus niger]GKZ96127.1 hypothetical protein AnigIFM59636_010370 [Aspergillus niger]GLA22852.1 hypothetical protein AnigIFM63326_005332 [Aspergillus ni
MSAVAEFLHLPTTVVRRAPRLSAGISQLTNRPAMPGKLAAISHGKLQREAASQTPDLRRCLGHHNILIRCVKAAQEDNARVMKETYEDDPDLAPTSGESEFPPIRTQITNAVKTMVRNRRTTTADKSSDNGLYQNYTILLRWHLHDEAHPLRVGEISGSTHPNSNPSSRTDIDICTSFFFMCRTMVLIRI